MEKYRPLILIFVWLALVIIGILCILFIAEGYAKVVLNLLMVPMLSFFILLTTYFIQFKNDGIIIRYSSDSTSKKYRSLFKTRIIEYKDIANLWINIHKKTVFIIFNDGLDIKYNFAAFIKADEIIDKFSKIPDVKKTIIWSKADLN